MWSEPLAVPPEDRQSAVWDLLHEVLDPEIPISLVDLGLIYDLGIADRHVKVRLTFTATACPCMAFIREDIEDRLLRESWIDRVEIEEVWDPPWTNDRISQRGRKALRRLGVGVSG
ncbi:MAG: metal-sulfur cluster assembly factor [Gemmatimonadetes bacterium]|nr:metal-sulfur cluster assembly factor [Gemmatimonadota bacterium]